MEENKNETNVIDFLYPDNLTPAFFDNMTAAESERFWDMSQLAVDMLLRDQSSANPAKRGGEDIAFRAALLILKNRQHFTTKENTLLDALTAEISSHPDVGTYYISIPELCKKFHYKNQKYCYEVLRDAYDSIKTKPLLFEFNNGKSSEEIVVPWYEYMKYRTEDSNQYVSSSQIIFRPSPFFRAIVICAGRVPGAYYPVFISSRISGEYKRNLFYLLEFKKGYRAYNDAPVGKFKMPIAELCDMIGYKRCRASVLEQKVLKPALNEFASIDEIDFSFSYEFSSSVKNSKKLDVITFVVKGKKDNKGKSDEQATALSQSKIDKESDTLSALLSPIVLSEKDLAAVKREFDKSGKTPDELKKIAAAVNGYRGQVDNVTGMLIYALRGGELGSFESKRRNDSKMPDAKKTSFHNFPEREYDYDEMEVMLLKAQRKPGSTES